VPASMNGAVRYPNGCGDVSYCERARRATAALRTAAFRMSRAGASRVDGRRWGRRKSNSRSRDEMGCAQITVTGFPGIGRTSRVLVLFTVNNVPGSNVIHVPPSRSRIWSTW
jgi:hypothetical protein